jgi:hypothetical protein
MHWYDCRLRDSLAVLLAPTLIQRMKLQPAKECN